MLEILHLVISPSKLRIFRLLGTPITPDELAGKLDITRQAVDKHLKELLKYGLVKKIWLLSSGRPKLEFVSSDLGNEFYREAESLITKHRESGKDLVTENLKDLDVQLVNGRIGSREYLRLKEDLVKESSWFLSADE